MTDWKKEHAELAQRCRERAQTAEAEIARLRARPTEEEVAQTICDTIGQDCACGECKAPLIARAVLALFPKVQP